MLDRQPRLLLTGTAPALHLSELGNLLCCSVVVVLLSSAVPP
jgi:hypothetical protein